MWMSRMRARSEAYARSEESSSRRACVRLEMAGAGGGAEGSGGTGSGLSGWGVDEAEEVECGGTCERGGEGEGEWE